MKLLLKIGVGLLIFMFSINIHAQVILDANENTMKYNNAIIDVTVPDAYLVIKGSGGIVSENGKKVVCPNKTKDKCYEISFWDAIKYKVKEIFSSPIASDERRDEELISEQELTVVSRENSSTSFVFPKGTLFRMISEGVYETAFENMIMDVR